MDLDAIPPGEVVCYGDGKTGIVTRAYPMEDKYALKALAASIEVRGPENTFFYFKRKELKRAVPITPGELGLDQPPQRQARIEAAATLHDSLAPAEMSAADSTAGTGPRRLAGVVKWFLRDKGFGKIAPTVAKGQPAEEDVFVHKNQCEGGGDGPHARELSEQVHVTYELTTQTDGKPCACSVQVEGVASAIAFASMQPAPAGNRVELIRGLLTSGMQVGTSQVRGEHKPTMEDRFVAKGGVTVDSLGVSCKKPICSFYGVFDGHSGGSCSDFVATSLDRNVFDCLRHQNQRDVSSEQTVKSSLLGAFRMTEHNYFQYLNRLEGGAAYAWASAGSTASTVMFFGPDEEERLRLAVANAGDSRAVLGKRDGRAVRLSEDHTPEVPSERKRIEQEGAAITQANGIWRIVLRRPGGESIAGLSVSRGFGDLDYKQPKGVVSAVPDVSLRSLDLREDSFVIIASDGVWGPMSDEDAVRVVAAGLREGGKDPANVAAQRLVEISHQKEGHDDKTVVVIWFGDLPDAPAALSAPAARAAGARRVVPQAARRTAGDDMFSGVKAPGRQADPTAELAQLDDLFSSYARDMKS